MMATRRRGGFTLPELLVAVSVASVVGAAVLSVLLYSFRIWTGAVEKNRELAAIDDFDLAFSRDFSCACPRLGFSGDSSSCAFWTRRLGGDGLDRLVRVRYSIAGGGIVLESRPSGDASPSCSRFATAAFGGFSYHGTNSPAGLPCWDDPGEAPRRVSLRFEPRRGLRTRRLYLRRTP